jgi:hypothetical protein
VLFVHDQYNIVAAQSPGPAANRHLKLCGALVHHVIPTRQAHQDQGRCLAFAMQQAWQAYHSQQLLWCDVMSYPA